LAAPGLSDWRFVRTAERDRQRQARHHPVHGAAAGQAARHHAAVLAQRPACTRPVPGISRWGRAPAARAHRTCATLSHRRSN